MIKLVDFIDSNDYYYLVMEYAQGGELFDKITSQSFLPEATAKLYSYQLLHATQYLHDMKVTHRDIKVE